jgi:tetratricopeptide (TPR) repeat protein
MIKSRIRFVTAATLLLALPAVAAKTWYLEQDQRWKLLPADCKDAFVKANAFHQRDKAVKAVRGYDKFLKCCDPNSELYTEALGRQFEIAMEFLGGRKRPVLGLFKIAGYAEGVRIMERISERAGEAIIGIDAAVEIAKHYEHRGMRDQTYFELAYLKWLELFQTYDKDVRISKPWPTGVLGKDALLGMARCKHAGYRGRQYDGSGLLGRALADQGPYDSAKGCYEQFKAEYPQDAERFDIDAKLNQVNEQLACKDLYIGRYYQKVGNQLSANLYYQMVIRDWPGTAAAESAKQMLAKNIGGERTRE